MSACTRLLLLNMATKELPKLIMADARANVPVVGSIFLSRDIEYSDDLSHVEGKRVLILVHGVKNTKAQVAAAYSQILNRASASFDIGVGFVWPAGSTPLAWPVVSTFADRSVGKLEELIDNVYRHNPASVSINAHSLGCPVAIKAINRPITSLWMLAPAMTRYIGRYANHFKHLTIPPQICYSKRDSALMMYMSWPPFLPALGMFGEGGRVKHGISHDFTNDVGFNHTGYRYCSKLYQLMLNADMERGK